MQSKIKPQRILFVCLGNICRSPAAEGVLRSLATEAGVSDLFEVDSAGTYSGHAGEGADYRMREAAYSRGYKLTHRARQITEEDMLYFDRIVVMDDNNFRDVERLAPSPEAARKIERFADLVTSIPDIHYVPDPYYEGREGFYRVLDILEDGCRTLIAAAHRH